jgi:hypothetical protein
VSQAGSASDTGGRRPAESRGDRDRTRVRRKDNAGLNFLRDYGLPILAILGVVLFGILRLSYLFFYLQLRTTPEEVGYDYARVLSESVVGAFVLVLLVFAPIMAVALAVRWLRASLRPRSPRRARSSVLEADEPSDRGVSRLALWCFAAAAALVAVSMPFLAAWQGRIARSGQTVRNVYFIAVPYLPVLPVQAVPARVVWVDPASDEQTNLSSRHCLMYLGTSDGIAVLYDVRTGASLRVPVSSTAVQLERTFFVPAECRVPTQVKPADGK